MKKYAVLMPIVSLVAACACAALPAQASVVDFITAGTSWGVPFDWTSTNTIECVGSGGTGFYQTTGYPNLVFRVNGGGGGAYAKISNLSLSGGSVSYYVDPGGSGGITYFNGSSGLSASLSCADGANGTAVSYGPGGTTANSIGTTLYAGGNGWSAGSCSRAGGGGAAGSHGKGNSSSSATGGSGDAGSGGSGGSGSSGGNGTEWSTSPAYGSGGGGGGSYGGGSYGGGGGADCPGTGGGAKGLIVVTYSPLPRGQILIYGGSVKIQGGSVIAK